MNYPRKKIPRSNRPRSRFGPFGPPSTFQRPVASPTTFTRSPLCMAYLTLGRSAGAPEGTIRRHVGSMRHTSQPYLGNPSSRCTAEALAFSAKPRSHRRCLSRCLFVWWRSATLAVPSGARLVQKSFIPHPEDSMNRLFPRGLQILSAARAT